MPEALLTPLTLLTIVDYIISLYSHSHGIVSERNIFINWLCTSNNMDITDADGIEERSIEQECEDAVFEVCDARERFPAMCANELARCVRLENEICMTPVKSRPPVKLDAPIITDQQIFFLENLGIGAKYATASNEQRNNKILHLMNKMKDLKVAVEQIEREKYEDINRLLRK